uniref:CCHC-type domain-containing protein n=1 Tax=Solanum tuberosum TaxID=4113 RepID=M1DGM1_SOLTU
MTTTRANVRRNEEDNVDQEVPPQAPIDPLAVNVTNENFRCGCLAGMEGCYGCGESGHKMRDCPRTKAKGRQKKKIRFYAPQARGEHDFPTNVAPVKANSHNKKMNYALWLLKKLYLAWHSQSLTAFTEGLDPWPPLSRYFLHIRRGLLCRCVRGEKSYVYRL